MIEEFFSPVDIGKTNLFNNSSAKSLASTLSIHVDDFPDLSGASIAIIGVMDGRESSQNEQCSEAPDEVRKYLYQLMKGSFAHKMVDLGNIMPLGGAMDTQFALTSTVEYLLERDILPLIIGGSKSLAYGQFNGHEKYTPGLDLVSVDSRIDLTENSYLNKIILHQPNFLFNLNVIGYQTYFIEQETIEAMEKMYFDAVRLGALRKNFEDVEPMLRSADMFVFDMSAIKQSDSPASWHVSPNGLTSDEACKIARYAGISEKVRSAGFYELNPSLDNRGQSAKLMAQMIWYFIDGFCSRRPDHPLIATEDFLKYRTTMDKNEHEFIFYKSKKTDRWWMEIPSEKLPRPFILPCSYSDYLMTLNNEMPDRWWRAFQKLG